MKILKFENKGKVYNEITKCTPYAKDKETLYKTKYLKIHSFSVVIDWLNSLLICSRILNENNLYEEIKDGLIILRLIKVYNPEVEIRGIFIKAIKKKCAIKNLEKALSIIYMNNPYYYSMVSSIDIYEKKKKKVNMLLLQLFDRFEFQNLKKISIPLLNWYNHTLKKFSLPLSHETMNDPFNVLNNKNKIYYNNEINDISFSRDHKDKNEKYLNYLKKQKKVFKTFASYVLFKDEQECNEMPHIVNEFSDCLKILLIFYRYGYFTREEFKNINNIDIRNNFFILQSLLRKLNIPIIFNNAYLNNPCEIAIILQLKYIQYFIHNNGYEKAIDLKKENYNVNFLLNQKNRLTNIKLKDVLDNNFKSKYNDYEIFDKNFNLKTYIRKDFEENNKQNNQKNNIKLQNKKKNIDVNVETKTDIENNETMDENEKGQNEIIGDNKSKIDYSETESSGKENSETERSGKENSETERSGKENSETESSGKENSETEFCVNRGNEKNSRIIKNIKNQNERLTIKTNERENEIEQISSEEKKNKKTYETKKETKKKNKEINEYIEKEIFKETPRKEIRKIFYEKIKEYMNGDKANINERIKYKIIDSTKKKDEVIQAETRKMTKFKVENDKKKQIEINHENIPLNIKGKHHIGNKQKVEIFKNNKYITINKDEKKEKITLKLENKSVPIKKPLNLIDDYRSKIKQNNQKNFLKNDAHKDKKNETILSK
ncbi:conserved Plasmodium protein, unknown function [Plasmodium gallinaceum]|uniref:Calponin-homology (CH) domain-containing protein n=1 Tax=Plasmodium gallinaceum TaxID=5849 RepID=A0A1J1GQR0_PLAGA|nr:conserved Plasmodium protein, unknown function [Plasmodium gallinaceum]CRG93378.1 conserved Plasmodium protein, unknown function [Plasmodium gallinaceum]